MSQALIKAEQLHYSYGPTRAVDGLSFELHKGDILGFLGPNGAGKSTTMQMLAGVLPADSGTISITGIDLQKKPIMAKRNIGYLPEIPPLYPELTVDEYLLYCGRLHRIDKQQLEQSLAKAKHNCGLVDQGSRLIRHLSKGYQQRVGIAQAIIHQPKVIIFDEPTVGLDPKQIIEIRKLITDLGHSHAVILSTHILPEVQAVCNKVQIIHQGKLVYTGNIDQLKQHSGQGSLIVAFNREPNIPSLNSLDYIHSCSAISPGRFRIEVDDIRSAAIRLTEHSVSQQWELHELIPEGSGLEQIFIDLTSGEITDGEQAA